MMQSVDTRKRHSIRLKGYDYAQVGAYFVTICTLGKESIFGEIHGTTVAPNQLSSIVSQSWEWLSHQYNYVISDSWVVMPNHTHSILIITEDPPHDPSAPKQKSLGSLIGAFKTFSTKKINGRMSSPGPQI
jgi:REP element-mobilizing transposase RayT